jgi:hypothetical protein
VSIPSNSVLRRILEDVVSGPVPSGFEAVECGIAAAEEIEVWRSRAIHTPPFATSLHFWAHALRALLSERDRPDAFGPLAGHCLCDAVPGARIADAFTGLAARISPSFSIERNADYRAGYRMIDQDEFVSWVAERDDEFVAVFWMRPAWIAQAQPLPIEPLEAIEYVD